MFWTIISIIFLMTILFAVLGYYIIPQSLWNFLVVNEEPKPSDVIIVLSGDTDRVPHAVSLFKAGYADKVLFSGGGAVNNSKRARALGVPADHILLEQKSSTTTENAKYSLEIMQSHGFKSAIVVTSPYHTRRSSIIFRQYFKGLDVTISSAPYDPSLSRNWWKDRDLAIKVILEYLKLVYHYLFEG